MKISEQIVEHKDHLQYAFPYSLKLFVVKFARLALRSKDHVAVKEDGYVMSRFTTIDPSVTDIA